VDRVQNRCYSSSGGVFTESSYHGGSGGSYNTMTCKSGYVVNGFHGRSGDEIDQIGLWCVEESDVENWSDPSGQTIYAKTPKGGSGGSYFSFRCGSGDAATGIFGRSGARVDRIGVWCKDKSPT